MTVKVPKIYKNRYIIIDDIEYEIDMDDYAIHPADKDVKIIYYAKRQKTRPNVFWLSLISQIECGICAVIKHHKKKDDVMCFLKSVLTTTRTLKKFYKG